MTILDKCKHYFNTFFTFLLFTFFTTSLYAIPTMDATNFKEPLELRGPWGFSPGIISHASAPELQHQSILLPHFVESKLNTSQSEVTFALKLRTLPNIPLTLDLNEPFSVWKLYINDILVAQSGKFAEHSTDHKAAIYRKNITFTPTSETTTLLIQLANSEHEHIGFYQTPTVASTEIMTQSYFKKYLFETVITALLILVGIYHIGLFAVWKKDKAPLWFGILSLFVALRMSSTSEMILVDVFDSLSWEMLLRTQYISGLLSLPLYVWYLDSLYPNQIIRVAKYFYFTIALFFLMLASFFPTLTFTPFLLTYEFVYLSFIIYTLIVLFRAVSVKETGSLLAFVTFVILSGLLIHDFLRFDNVIASSTDIAPYGFVLYLIAQAAILLQRYAQTFTLIEEHTDNLEHVVADRTKELSRLVEQRELLLRELTHRVKNNLQFIISLILIQRKEADPRTLVSLKTLESQIQSISSVHETLCSQENVTFVELNNYMLNFIHSIRNFYPKVEITYTQPSTPFYINPDHAVSLGLIINELITNHLKHSNPTDVSPVIISIESNEDTQIVLHYRDGHDHREMFHHTEVSTFGLPKLGWPMIKVLIKQINGEIIPYKERLEIKLNCYNEDK
ncbi:histidine kinase dimerization/phosphoacceptor domain -containing protein [Sulfuricurvum sp.]|uniref:histidine kinase dimerization/phosphoacceptor domain -containing protein n=1 Tax=Sulfuricurvum sp. TaxID=2025608 RepID=UPI002627CE90|nr:histidine kinase dimerization/phosphoacceptor domain -containing protein [Sulfuricurvum sp.]MDD2781797.1 histidine kinase dimerization/phosphoacceptor domain -containing protein [Sulfuricurvum sp.]